ncbi:threonine synthase [Algimonas arctica]|uniref:Threonine synthase n=1 Tax=Algimonas arctica TaxID=1479486 RepID=A0A8J3G199_9PROT|nr:threonine synthase [Algimonas arctica]GHA83982.1 threonine synthase [Algimonas arctica]
MKYHSHLDTQVTAEFGDALLASLAPDGGLWMPDKIPHFTPDKMAVLGAMDFADCAAKLATYFTDNRFDETTLKALCADAYNFDVPMVTFVGQRLDPAMPVQADEFVLELFHGPTLAFKDFAARFMGRAASHLMKKSGERRTILVATSGDTGGAIGDAFLGQDGVEVFILFPKGGVSTVQERQLCTIGKVGSNVHAISIDGTFDDCQALVKAAFADQAMTKRFDLMSANSINVGRVVPQSFYYVWASLQAKAAYPKRKLVMSIPSGNLGNLTGGLMARAMGAPIDRFIVANNANDPFVDYLVDGEYRPRPSVPTLSNAMDIGRPNNFPRILSLFGDDIDAIRSACWGVSFDDDATARHIRRVYQDTGYLLCPHTAVGHMGILTFRERHDIDATFLTVGTAHPAKFADSLEGIIHKDVPLPPSLAAAMTRKPRVTTLLPTLEALSDYIASELG